MRRSEIGPYMAPILCLIVALMPPRLAAATDLIAPFLGTFVGASLTDTASVFVNKDIDVNIRRTRLGFAVDWDSVVVEGGSVERFGHHVQFERTQSPGVYRAHRTPGITGTPRAADPIDGRPYFWATVSGNALTVYVLKIGHDGSVDLRKYRRVRQGDRLRFEFNRFRDGQPLRTATGILVPQ